MGRATGFIYSAITIYLALDLLFIHFIPELFVPISVIVVGVITLLTPGVRFTQGVSIPRFQFLTRWVFGLLMIVMGLITVLSQFTPSLSSNNLFIILSNLVSLYYGNGQFILLAIGIVSLVADFTRTR